MNVTKIFFKTIQILLGVVVASFAALLFLNHYGNTQYFHPYVVQSGSMEPAIPVGSVIFSMPATNYLQGEVITFSPDNDSKKLVTHRIAYKEYPKGIYEEPIYKTVGDANEEIDRWEIAPSQIIGKVVLSVPYLGYAVDFAKTPKGFILFVIIPATIVIYEELKTLLNEIRKMVLKLISKSKSTNNQGIKNYDLRFKNEMHTSKILILLPIFGTCIVLIAFTKAYFFDNEKATQNVIGVSTSYTPTPPIEIPVVQTIMTEEVEPTISVSLTPTP